MIKKAVFGIVVGSIFWFILTNLLDICLGTFTVDSILSKLTPLIIILLLSTIVFFFGKKTKVN